MQEFDVSKYEIEEFAPLTIQNARGDDDLLGNDGKPVVFELYSAGSKLGVRALHKAGQQAQLRLQGMMRGKVSKTAAEEADREQVEKLTAFTKSISANFPVAPDAVYSNPKLGYIRRQVEAHIGDDGNFSKASTPNSPSTSDNVPG